MRTKQLTVTDKQTDTGQENNPQTYPLKAWFKTWWNKNIKYYNTFIQNTYMLVNIGSDFYLH